MISADCCASGMTQCHLWVCYAGHSSVQQNLDGFQMHTYVEQCLTCAAMIAASALAPAPATTLAAPNAPLLLYQPESLMTSLRRCISGQDQEGFCRILLGHHRLYQTCDTALQCASWLVGAF